MIIWPPTGTRPLRQVTVSKPGIWNIAPVDGGAAIDVLDAFGVRRWSTASVAASDAAIRSWIDCAGTRRLDCALP